MFYVYVLESKKNGELYTGYTHDLVKRAREHNQGVNFSTKPGRPWKCIYYEACIHEEDAKRREKYLKTTQGKRLLKARLKEYFYLKKIQFEISLQGMYQAVLQKVKPEMEKAIGFFQTELAKIRTGQASPSLVEDVQVNVFGEMMPLKQLAGISCPERRQILIEPWDQSYAGPIEKALHQSSLGTSPVVEGKTIRVHLPQLNQEYREQLAKLLGEKAEETRKIIRKWREDAWEEVQKEAKQGEIREDDKFRAKEELQKLIDDFGKKIEELVERKKREIEVV